ncbi:MAG: imidazolonepropionase [Candidatus Dormibacteria bacterium]
MLRNIGELFTASPAQPVIAGPCAVFVESGLIRWCGRQADLPEEMEHAATENLNVHGAAVIPGFVDCHTHLIHAGDRAGEFAERHQGRSYAEIAAAGGGIRATVQATDGADDATLLNGARIRAGQALATGTTTIEVKTGYAGSAERELRLLDLVWALELEQTVVPTVLPLHAPYEGLSHDEHCDVVIREVLPQAASRAMFCDVFCDRETFTVEQCRRVLTAAAEMRMRLKVHADQLGPSGGGLLAAEMSAYSADHLEHCDRVTAAALARAGTIGVLLPGAHLSLGGRAPDARMMIEEGMTLALATDCNPGTSCTTDMRLMVALAVGLFGLTPTEAVTAATRGAALALGPADCGHIAVGMRADLLILDADSHIDIAYRMGDVAISPVLPRGLSGTGSAR